MAAKRPGVPEPDCAPSSSKAAVPKAHLPQPLFKRRKVENKPETVGTVVTDKGVDQRLLQQDVKKDEQSEVEWEAVWDDATQALWCKDQITPGLWWFKKTGETWRRWKDKTVPWLKVATCLDSFVVVASFCLDYASLMECIFQKEISKVKPMFDTSGLVYQNPGSHHREDRRLVQQMCSSCTYEPGWGAQGIGEVPA